MDPSDIIRPEYSSKIIGGSFIALGAYLLLFTTYSNAAIGAIFIGIFTALIVNQRTVESGVSAAGLNSGVEPLDRLLDDLDVRGNGIMVPPGANLTESRNFIPVREFSGLPDLYDEMIVVTAGGGRTGISIPPVGKPLLDEAKDRMEYSFEGEGIEGIRETMGMLSHGMGLAKSYSLRERDDKIMLRITHGDYLDFCEERREGSELICRRTGCPICSAYLTAIAEGLSAPVRISDFEKEDRHIKFTLERVG